MANISVKKSDTISQMVELIPQVEEFVSRLAEFSSFVTDNAFKTGGANAIIDADFVGPNQHMTAVQFNAVVAVFNAITINAGQKTTLRQASNKANPW